MKQKSIQEELDKVTESMSIRRKEFVENTRASVKSLYIVGIDEQDQEHVDAFDFAANMALSEIFRSVAYWEGQLQISLQTIQKKKNEEV